MLSQRIPVGLMILAGVVAVLAVLFSWGGAEGASPEAGAVGESQGYYNSCVLFDAGKAEDYGVKCWGENDYGQLGDGTTIYRTVPVTAIADGVVSVSVAWSHACALMGDGKIKCWGANNYGQLGFDPDDQTALDDCDDGPGFESCSLSPIEVPGVEEVSEVLASSGAEEDGWTCALRGDFHAVQCWGFNTSGQLGDGTVASRHTLRYVCAEGATYGPVWGCGFNVLTGVESITSGTTFTCALMKTIEKVKCWGANDSLAGGVPAGEVSDTCDVGFDIPCNLMPRTVCNDYDEANDKCDEDFSGALQISAGAGHVCARVTGDIAKCWGSNLLGMLGDGGGQTRYNPEYVCESGSGPACPPLGNVKFVAGGSTSYHACARIDDEIEKTAMCWGYDSNGQLGNGDNLPNTQVLPVPVLILTDITDISLGGLHTCATDSGTLKCWGRNWEGQLGDGNGGWGIDSFTPVVVLFIIPESKDTDGDGCTDIQELGLDETLGGRRDPFNQYDWYDVASSSGEKIQDDIVDSDNDKAAVVAHILDYDVYFDRGAPPVGADPWDMTAPDGSITLGVDIVGVINQAGHSCA